MLKVRRPARLDSRYKALAHQLDALEAIKDLPFAAVFHEQGLGKTKIGIDLLLSWLIRDVVDSVLVVVKKGLVENWRTEVRRHCYLTPRVLGQDRNANFYAFNSPVRLYLAHYEVIVSEQKRLKLFLRTRRVGVVLDEAQKIKNPNTRVSEALHSLSSDFVRRIIMTGTPVANRPYDLWSQIRFLDGGCALGCDFNTFKRDLDLTGRLARDGDHMSNFSVALEKTYEKVRRFSVRETKRTVGLDLPDKTISNIECDLESRQAEIYDQFRDELSAIIVQAGRPVLDETEVILKRLLRLVQVASNPYIIDQAYNRKPGKLIYLAALVHGAVDENEKIVIWTSFRRNADYLGREFAEFDAAVVHGGVSAIERYEALEKFKNDRKCAVLVATPGAAKEGLTLTVANHAVFFDRSFSLDDYLQAQDRIHRISQEKPCYVTNLIGIDTVDSWVDALLSAKHLAAQLGQGDISRTEYESGADYTFFEMVQDVLGIDEGEWKQ